MATYVYGIVSASHPARLDELAGVGEPPTTLRRIEAGELAAVVSDAPDGLRAKRRDLLAHQQVLEQLCEQGATLPMRFGYTAADDDTVAGEVATGQERYGALLSEVDRRVEINVKARHHEEAVLRELLTNDDSLRTANEDLRERGGSTDERIAFGERVSAALEQRKQGDAEHVLARLREVAVAESAGPAVEDYFVNTSFLVDRAAMNEFAAAADELTAEFGWLIDLTVRGPLPPYSFTELSAAAS